jgi:NAD(P)H dehydrogenase (quinone)
MLEKDAVTVAEAVVKGANDAGAKVRLRRVAELARERAICQQDAWREQCEATVAPVAEVTLDDLRRADGHAFGTATRFGLPSGELEVTL